ncbi:similar to Saccharomyces cerevisiae YOR059C Lipid particle protein of unknown function [Maudiozyma barnettii]|uniref:DUF676 domain-containing protein n=1 Tax=Maudiozyma barnettii TaxID=61262 RepID=A0A8H2ZJ84_9SACH|nr:putative hydrolase [Kazachstania barnettii]CAB4256277.1 similar to Saccharomyces cerevisiae YOR059C Lipid particle protein of unknown function [Kazachstania barnettii]CAD1784886.1 similar to Saccharomyces cerevisiae YOR059C Lipid particle protein of unknown function [Kazachstania barnettii]
MSSQQGSHLFVLIHGLWGTPQHMGSLKESLQHYIDSKENAIFLLPSQNSKFKTFDGIEVLGYRALLEICQYIRRHNDLQECSDHKRITRISIIGYSLGGLVARFVVGKMFTECQEYFSGIEPVLFLTMASPHLGIRFFNPSNSLFRTILDPVMTVLGSNALGKSGRELFIANRYNDILIRLSEGEFIQGLAKFKHRTVCANVKNDRTVAFYTAFITNHDPFIESGNSVNYTFENNVPGTGYSNIIPRIVDLTRLDPKNKHVIENKRLSLNGKLKLYILLPCLFLVFFPIALLVNISGTVYRYFATIKYRKMIKNGNLPNEFREKVGISDRLETYVSATYESILKENESGNDGDLEDDDDLIQNGGKYNQSMSKIPTMDRNSRDKKWDIFIQKYSNIVDEKNMWYKRFDDLPFDNKRIAILKNLSSLKWIRVPIYVKALNAHGGIIARRGIDEDTQPTSLASIQFVGQLVDYLTSTN